MSTDMHKNTVALKAPNMKMTNSRILGRPRNRWRGVLMGEQRNGGKNLPQPPVLVETDDIDDDYDGDLMITVVVVVV
jgi:hypothetical protein